MKNISIHIIYAFVALFGGIAKYLHEYQLTGKFHWGFFLAGMFISVFSGYMFAVLGTAIGVSEQIRILLSGLGGYMGTRTMDFIEEYIRDKYVKNPPQDKGQIG